MSEEKTYTSAEAFVFCVTNPGVILESVNRPNCEHQALIKYAAGDTNLSASLDGGKSWVSGLGLSWDYRLHVKRYTGLEALRLAAETPGRMFKSTRCGNVFRVHSTGCIGVRSNGGIWVKTIGHAFDDCIFGPFTEVIE